ncbi:MAG: hypothetical protein V1791_05240, partial [Pseudomonadota bacterium]
RRWPPSGGSSQRGNLKVVAAEPTEIATSCPAQQMQGRTRFAMTVLGVFQQAPKQEPSSVLSDVTIKA